MGQTGSIANSLFYSAVKTLHIQQNKYQSLFFLKSTKILENNKNNKKLFP
jgi:hypothetical protein